MRSRRIASRPTRPTTAAPMTQRRKTLGGSVFIHNAIQYDYCLRESLFSLAALCDDVVVLDAQSTDGTTDLLRQIVREQPKIRLIEGAVWECGEKYDRLAILANQVRQYLNTDWHFMLQADEVIHESSFSAIREAIDSGKAEAFFVRRLNFFGDYNHHIKIDQPSEHKPCGDQIIRLALTRCPAHGDAESLLYDYNRTNTEYTDRIRIFHYGMVRDDAKFIKKIIDMQGWFFGPGGQPDARVLEMDRKGDNVFDWTTMKTKEMLTRLEGNHPRFAQRYVEDRQARKPMKVE